MTGGGAAATVAYLPESWTRPVIASVLLPSHAQLSPLPPPVEVDFEVSCGDAFACEVGVDDATQQIPVVNLSGGDITLTDVEFSNPNHALQTPALPLIIPGGECRRLGITDSSEVCGDQVGEGTATLNFDGFSPFGVDLPLGGFGP